MDFLSAVAVTFVIHAKVNAMRLMFPPYSFSPPRRKTEVRQMRERRTAQILMVFGIVLACVELYVVIGNIWRLS